MTDLAERIAVAHDRQQWSGARGLAELQARLPCTSRDATQFRARARSIGSAGLRLVEWHSTELRGEAPLRSAERLALVQVQVGVLRLQDPLGRVEVGQGRIACLPRGRFAWAVSGGVRLRALLVPVGLVPTRLVDVQAGGGLLDDTPLTRGLADGLTTFMQSGLASTAPSDYVGQALRALTLAVLEERVGYGAGSAPTLREHIVRYVDSQLSNPDLTPSHIAAAFDVSIRWVHKAFNRDGETLALFIRHRRVDAAAEEIRANPRAAQTQQLAMAYGFSGRDHLNRVFRARYGMSVHEYRERELQSFVAASASGAWRPEAREPQRGPAWATAR